MEEIKLKDINLSNLRKLPNQGTQSTIYTDEIICYKFLRNLYPNELRALYTKFLDMDGIKLENILLPQSLIMENGKLKGYTMKYFASSKPLSDKFLKRFFNCNELFILVTKASYILRDIHNNGIICQDLSFENILVDENGNIMFCDIDSCTYKKHNSPFISKLLKEFLIDYRHSKLYTKEDIDKLSMILSFYLTIYDKVLQNITKKEYHLLSDNINTLKNLLDIAITLIDKNYPIKDLPYLDEVIDLNDNYEIDRQKVLKRSLFRK